MYSVGEVIREARQQRGWGQRRLADVSGVAQPNVAAIEAGTRVPSLALVARLVRACGLQLRFDLEPRHTDVDAAIRARRDGPPSARVARPGADALLTAARLTMAGTRLVLDGPLAAQLHGAPVRDATERVWCRTGDLDQLRRSVARCHLELRPVRFRDYDDEYRPVLGEGDQVQAGSVTVTLGTPPPASQAVELHGAAMPIVDLDHLLAYPHWTPADRIAVRRLAVLLDTLE